VFLSLLLAID